MCGCDFDEMDGHFRCPVHGAARSADTIGRMPVVPCECRDINQAFQRAHQVRGKKKERG